MIPVMEERHSSKDALRALKKRYFELTFIKEINKCKDCNVKVGSLREHPIILKVNRKVDAIFYPSSGEPIKTKVQTTDLCGIHQPMLDAFNKEYADSGWW